MKAELTHMADRLQSLLDGLKEVASAIHSANLALRRAVRLLGEESAREEVHHIDGNLWNNDPSNLEIVRREA